MAPGAAAIAPAKMLRSTIMRLNFRRAETFILLMALTVLGWGGAGAAGAAEAGGSLNLDQAIDSFQHNLLLSLEKRNVGGADQP